MSMLDAVRRPAQPPDRDTDARTQLRGWMAQPETEAVLERAMLRAAQRDLAAFAPLYERYAARLYLYCLRRVENEREAEDLTAQIVARALTHIGGYRGGSVAAWLFRIAHNAVANHHRHGAAHPEPISLDALPDAAASGERDDADPLDTLLQLESQQQVRAWVAALPPMQQDMLLLRVVAGLSADEIGAIVGKRAGAVRVELHRIILRLRRAAGEDGTS